jgi:hypothetical protein
VLPGVGEELAQEVGIDPREGDADRGQPLAPPDLLASARCAFDGGENAALSSMTFIRSSLQSVAKIFPPTRNDGRPW